MQGQLRRKPVRAMVRIDRKVDWFRTMSLRESAPETGNLVLCGFAKTENASLVLSSLGADRTYGE
jgi:hypothetical protein